jgi:molybdate-binding protein
MSLGRNAGSGARRLLDRAAQQRAAIVSRNGSR